MSLSKYQAPDIKKCECDFEFDEKSLLSMPEPTLLGNLIDDSNPLVKEGDQICKSPTPKFTLRKFQSKALVHAAVCIQQIQWRQQLKPLG